jgi:hypothetical protein
MWKMAKYKSIEEGAQELDKYLCTIITTENDLEQHVIHLQKLYKQHAGEPLKRQTQGRRTSRKSQSSGGRTVSL